ncbi:Testis-specific serine/threonine-protein kinase 3, partial [Geodia barretti]
NSSRGQRLASSSSDDHQSLVPYCFRNSVTSPEQLHYSIGKTIGSGTYAKVKAAWSPYERKMIAIKILEKRGASQEVLDKFLPREMAVVRRLNHPSILRVFHVVETPREVYFMLEMAENGDLLDYINWRRFLPEPEARYVLRGVAAGVSHCHSKNIVHRDLKCENIMITREMRVKIGDFGFSRLVGRGESPVTTPCGSYSYAAPELLSSRPGDTYDGKKSDIWSINSTTKHRFGACKLLSIVAI